MPKIYRTMQGEQVDIEALFRKNELTIAVGNMRTNARGDEIGPGGTVVKTREQKAREYYQRQKARKAAEGAQAKTAPAAQQKPVDLNAPLDKPLAKTTETLEDPDGIDDLDNIEDR